MKLKIALIAVVAIIIYALISLYGINKLLISKVSLSPSPTVNSGNLRVSPTAANISGQTIVIGQAENNLEIVKKCLIPWGNEAVSRKNGAALIKSLDLSGKTLSLTPNAWIQNTEWNLTDLINRGVKISLRVRIHKSLTDLDNMQNFIIRPIDADMDKVLKMLKPGVDQLMVIHPLPQQVYIDLLCYEPS